MFGIDYLFKEINFNIFAEKLEGYSDICHVWDILKRINEGYVANILKPAIKGTVSPGAFLEDNVYIGEGTIVEPGAYIKGPTIIGKNCQILHGAYIRGNVLVGDNSVVGHCTEVVRSLFLPGAKAPHFNYVGDSILGSKVNLGAGTKLSNLKNVKSNVLLKYDGKEYKTGLRKFGAILGDGCMTGCNVVLNPGTIMGPECIVYANTSVRGIYPARKIVKLRQKTERADNIL